MTNGMSGFVQNARLDHLRSGGDLEVGKEHINDRVERTILQHWGAERDGHVDIIRHQVEAKVDHSHRIRKAVI